MEEKIIKCPYCGSENIEKDIKFTRRNELFETGLSYKDSGIMSHKVAQVYCNLCLDCGTIVRTYITDTTNKKWEK